MSLEILPSRVAGAAENMALDFLMLQRYPNGQAARFRHYGWRTPAFTFGYSQKIAFVREAIPTGETFDLCRRPTGGGLVDHRDDWTFSLVIPRGHPLEDVRATQSYRAVHECLAEALRRQDIPAVTKRVADSEAIGADALAEPADRARRAAPSAITGAAGVCFERAELYDVIHESSGRKIAGAAQKRNKHGLLFQGSLSRPAIGSALDDEKLAEDFAGLLAIALQMEATPVPWPEFNEDEVAGLSDTYASPEWIEAR